MLFPNFLAIEFNNVDFPVDLPPMIVFRFSDR